MRILMVQTYHYYRGGDSTYMFNLSRLLEQKGHEVIHFAMQHPQNIESEYSGYFTSEIDFPSLLAESSAGAALKVLSRSIYNSEARKAIDRLIEDKRPDIAHFNNIHGHLTTSIIAPLRKRGIPIVWTLHDYRLVCPNTTFLRGDKICELCLPKRYWNCVMHKCKKGSLPASIVAMMTTFCDRVSRVPSKVERFITPSRFLMGKLVEGKIKKEKIVSIPNFVDVGSFTPRAEKGYFFYFGRLSHEKGIDLLIEAVSSMKNVSLKIAGEGPLSADLKKLVAEKGADVEFLGFVTGDDLRLLLEESSCVVVPSRWYENLPFSVMEALAVGKPVVAADIGGIPEMVEDGVNGLLFPAGDREKLAECLGRMAGDRDMRRRMGEAGRKKAEELYDTEAHYCQIIGLYNEATGKTPEE
ncbi:MAG: glycosyltransferase family 4 protein [Candidatus Krumholzibacteriota bacterium]|nr:glycosyltransferase family 4 protein [Candidatus Krumholzibacteriota bacterium]